MGEPRAGRDPQERSPADAVRSARQPGLPSEPVEGAAALEQGQQRFVRRRRVGRAL
ncbi:hypothetical protein STRIP9103_00358, partial [Streptomyces ipomoeae 91-03]